MPTNGTEMTWFDSASHSNLSPEPGMICLPFSKNAADVAQDLCSSSSEMTWPDSASHTLIVLSSVSDKMCLPSSENATDMTLWWLNTKGRIVQNWCCINMIQVETWCRWTMAILVFLNCTGTLISDDAYKIAYGTNGSKSPLWNIVTEKPRDTGCTMCAISVQKEKLQWWNSVSLVWNWGLGRLGQSPQNIRRSTGFIVGFCTMGPNLIFPVLCFICHENFAYRQEREWIWFHMQLVVGMWHRGVVDAELERFAMWKLECRPMIIADLWIFVLPSFCFRPSSPAPSLS